MAAARAAPHAARRRAEREGVGLRVVPRKGLAAVFWTHTAEGLDAYSWHAGAKLPPAVIDGKLLLQKFKALPAEFRSKKGEPQRLPAALAPPAP